MALSLQRYTWTDANSRFNHLLKERLNRDKQRSMIISLEKIDHLPENLIVEILSRLPVKDLLQFKSVCKSWYSIISSPNFITKHLKNYYYNPNNDSWKDCLLVQYYVTHAELQLYELFVDETRRVLANEVLYSMPMYSSYVYGPCDGIYYVYQYDSNGRALWNPAINEFRTLPRIISKPHLPSNLTYASNEVYGFGVDPLTRDYKVVVVKGHWSTNEDITDNVKFPVSVLVYSLRTDSWKYCGDLGRAYDLETNKCYIYVNGCCYWFGSYDCSDDDDDDEVIISFDMATDAFKEMDVPDYSRPSSKCLGMYDDSLAFLCLSDTEKVFDVWTLNEECCWIKKISVGPLPEVRSPIGHWKDNRLILQCKDGKLVVYDPKTQEVRDLAFQKDRWCEGAFAYMESLVSIKDTNETEEVEAGNIPV
ncbi:hypothetical protein RDABS01_022441 [Bienertia sinuspersici]